MVMWPSLECTEKYIHLETNLRECHIAKYGIKENGGILIKTNLLNTLLNHVKIYDDFYARINTRTLLIRSESDMRDFILPRR